MVNTLNSKFSFCGSAGSNPAVGTLLFRLFLLLNIKFHNLLYLQKCNMTIKIHRPISPGIRHYISIDKKSLNNSIINKKLKHNLKKSGGRNNLGRLTSFHTGGGHKQQYRNIDFKRKLKFGVVKAIEYDPNRSTNIAQISNDIQSSYILSPKDLKVGDVLDINKFQVGNMHKLLNLNIGSYIHNIEFYPNTGGRLVRSAGNFAQLVQRTLKNKKVYAQIRLRSGKKYLISAECNAVIGILSNEDYRNIVLGKAGRARWLNRRPNVRGVAMNAVDHPHGGGRGKTSGGRPSVSAWARLTKGYKTRNKKKKNLLTFYI